MMPSSSKMYILSQSLVLFVILNLVNPSFLLCPHVILEEESLCLKAIDR
jgi:hypothetical protein